MHLLLTRSTNFLELMQTASIRRSYLLKWQAHCRIRGATNTGHIIGSACLPVIVTGSIRCQCHGVPTAMTGK